MRRHLSLADKAVLYASMFENSQDGLVVVDKHLNILLLNEVAKKICAIDASEYESLRISDLFESYDYQCDFQLYETRVLHNHYIAVSLFQYPAKVQTFPAEKIVIVKNITERTHTERALLAERERAQVTLQCVHDAVIITDPHGGVEYLNPVAESYTGWSDAAAHGVEVTEVFSVVDATTNTPLPDPVQRCLQAGHKVQSIEYSLLKQRHGQERAVEFTAMPMRCHEGEYAPGGDIIVGAVLVFRDVTQMMSMARQMAYQTTHDALTGLINRQAFEACLHQALQSAKDAQSQHVLCYLDLDQFKIVNDTCGHAAGDELLKQLATLLRSHLRYTDILSRLGGDEFGLILQDCPIEDACQVVEDLRQALRNFRFAWDDKTFEISISIGIVPITSDGGDLATTLSAADSACFLAKEQGRNRIQIYQPDDTVVAQRYGEMQWVHRITRALSEERFCLYFQKILPITRPAPGRVHGEVLVRMVDEQGALVPPAAFIPAAERYNLMPAIDRWVIRTAFATMAQTLGRNAEHSMGMSINLSGQSLCDDQLLAFVVEQFRLSGVTPERVCFEITETAVIANLSRAIQLMVSLRDIGCRFALDDFGSGLSSFAYLKRLPVDYLKIDGGFVRGMLEDPIDYAIVDSINQIGHVMGILTIAEFVENDEMLTRLKDLGVDYAQGYGVAHPEPLVQ